MRKIYTNAVIATMDYDNPFVTAMVTENGRIIYSGNDSEAMLYACPGSEIRDMDGKTILPGFNDSHMHFLHYVKRKLSVNLSDAKSVDDIVLKMKRRLTSSSLPAGCFLIGEGWNQDLFTEGEKRFPCADDLDMISSDVPVLVLRACFHIGVLNHCAMKVLGIDAEAVKKAGSFAETDESGNPNGVIKENFLEEIKTRLPYPPLDELFSMLLDAQEDLFRCGITFIQSDDMKYAPSGEAFGFLDMLRDASENGMLKVRYSEQALVESREDLDSLLSYRYLKSGNGHFRISTVKIISDGSLGARTAFLKDEYADMPGTRGIPIYDQDTLDDFILSSNIAGMPAAVHAIGNGAMEMCLDSFERSSREGCGTLLRNGIVHCQITEPEQIERFSHLNLLAFTQPVFIDYDMHIVYDRVGKDLAETSYAWNTFLKSGVHESFGTDCPVEGFNPFAGIYCAVTRNDKKGYGPYLPGEAVSVYDAVYCYTAAGAYASLMENDTGMLKSGYMADFIVLDRNIFSCSPSDIPGININETYIDGEPVFKKFV